nr:hypothetical protein HK105_000471 [Polyrhizophydium stewartii]
MGADIYRDFPAARDVIDECNDIVGGGLRELMFDGPQKQLTSTINAQPAILCHSIAILRVLESMQSSVTNKETIMRALVVTGDHLEDIEQTMQRIQRSLPEGEVAEIANINSRTQIVLSGTVKGVEYAASIVHTKGFAGRSLPLPVSAPFHCSLMAPAAEVMGPALEAVQFSQPAIDVVSNVTGRPFKSAAEIGPLLKRQIVETVQWERSLRYAKEDFVFDWIVVGPSRVLSNLLRKEFPHDVIRPLSTSSELSAWRPQ